MDQTNLSYIEEQYRAWQADPTSVAPEWRSFFLGFEQGLEWKTGPNGQELVSADMVYKQSRVDSLLWAYRDVGYLYARLNPLAPESAAASDYLNPRSSEIYEQLTLEEFGLSENDLDTVFSAGRALKPPRAPLREIIQAFRETYCGHVGVEFLHIQSKPIRRWLIGKMESSRNRPQLSLKQRQIILKDLLQAEEFEHFLHTTFIGQKRFSLEGSEVLIPALHFLVDIAHEHGIEEMVIGTTHRGRLTILNRILNMPPEEVFTMFEGSYAPQMYGGSGDVKYHLGYSTDHRHADGSSVHISLAANPSHLESVGPVVLGKARGAQQRRQDESRRRVVPVIFHGDAAFAGQGVVAECFNLSQLAGYTTGGTIHIVINNQIGFTTPSRSGRSTFFPTDMAKMLPVPIFHVNGDDPEAVVYVVRLALEYRQTFGQDVVIDIFCFRRHGHNEGDEPSFTHPRMYQIIEQHPGVAALYGERCEREEVMSRQEQEAQRGEFRQALKAALAKARESPSRPGNRPLQRWDWQGLEGGYSHEPVETGVPEATLRRIASVITSVPEGFHIHPKLLRILQSKNPEILDWGFAESLAFGSLLLEGQAVRLSGQDSVRGTFAQRHLTWWDVQSPRPSPYTPLNHLGPDQAELEAYDSPLSEYSVLGFEYGFSLDQPRMLTLWEAQFGDFVNGAQVIIDNYIVAAESKWNRHSGLVLLLPHGYEGQGPEHSSAHLERFLQLCAEDNIQVVNATTPAQYFHLLRRQVKRNFRKPLVVFTPKSLLRHPRAVSPLADLTSGSFREVLDDPARPEAAQRLILCTGKIFYELLQRREELAEAGSRPDTAIVRLEQLYPFPESALQAVLAGYPAVRHRLWVQEEPRNRGAWSFISALRQDLEYIGRPAAASPATGSFKRHRQEQEELLERAFGAPAAAPKNRRRSRRDAAVGRE